MTVASYVYAIVEPTDIANMSLRGIDGAEVRLVRAGNIAALVSSVDDVMFDEHIVQSEQLDLTWLERVARAHDNLINSAAAATTTVPLRLGTTCVDDSSVAELLHSLEPAAARALERVAGCAEWAVHVFAAPVGGDAASARPGESGTDFLKRRRAALESQVAQESTDATTARTVFEALAEVAVDARLHPRQDRRLRRDRHAMIMNAAFLVDRTETDRFLAEVERLNRDIATNRLEFSGPWAAYSFAELASS